MQPALAHYTASVNGIRLHYVTAGAGDPVVLLHGWPQTWREWRQMIPALAGQYTVVAPDLRGFGDSDKPAGGYDKRTVAEDIWQLVGQLGLGPIHLVGHDIGMMVAYAYASAHPAQVRSLVLAEAGLPGLGLEAFFDAAQHPELYHFGFFRTPNLAETLISGRERLFITHFIRQLAYDPTGVADDDLDEYARCLAAPGGLRGGFEHYRAFDADAEHNREHARTLLPMPILAIGGVASVGGHVEQVVRPLGRDVQGLVVERAGHWLFDEQPDQMSAALLDFFRRNTGPGA